LLQNLLHQSWRDAHGPLYPHNAWRTIENALQTELKRLHKLTGIPWRANALRHSYGSHRLAVAHSYDQVAVEMGNSPAKVREHYNDPKPADVAKAYFSLFPPAPDRNVIPLPLQFR
jgi:hypothetical protein